MLRRGAAAGGVGVRVDNVSKSNASNSPSVGVAASSGGGGGALAPPSKTLKAKIGTLSKSPSVEFAFESSVLAEKDMNAKVQKQKPLADLGLATPRVVVSSDLNSSAASSGSAGLQQLVSSSKKSTSHSGVPAPPPSIFRDALTENAPVRTISGNSGNSPINVVPKDLSKLGVYNTSGSSPLAASSGSVSGARVAGFGSTDAPIPRSTQKKASIRGGGPKISSARRPEKAKRERELWTPEEDERLKALVAQHGAKKWSHISKLLDMGRNKKQCRERWANHLKEGIVKSRWTEEEDKVIIDKQAELGNCWAQISTFLPGRTDNAVKNHWNASLKNKIKDHKGGAKADAKNSRKRDRKNNAGGKLKQKRQRSEVSSISANASCFPLGARAAQQESGGASSSSGRPKKSATKTEKQQKKKKSSRKSRTAKPKKSIKSKAKKSGAASGLIDQTAFVNMSPTVSNHMLYPELFYPNSVEKETWKSAISNMEQVFYNSSGTARLAASPMTPPYFHNSAMKAPAAKMPQARTSAAHHLLSSGSPMTPGLAGGDGLDLTAMLDEAAMLSPMRSPPMRTGSTDPLAHLRTPFSAQSPSHSLANYTPVQSLFAGFFGENGDFSAALDAEGTPHQKMP